DRLECRRSSCPLWETREKKAVKTALRREGSSSVGPDFGPGVSIHAYNQTGRSPGLRANSR
ncbi:MAG: hypothetical protein ACKO9Q_30630, partial [Pirellula sp.]